MALLHRQPVSRAADDLRAGLHDGFYGTHLFGRLPLFRRPVGAGRYQWQSIEHTIERGLLALQDQDLAGE